MLKSVFFIKKNKPWEVTLVVVAPALSWILGLLDVKVATPGLRGFAKHVIHPLTMGDVAAVALCCLYLSIQDNIFWRALSYIIMAIYCTYIFWCAFCMSKPVILISDLRGLIAHDENCLHALFLAPLSLGCPLRCLITPGWFVTRLTPETE